MIEMPKQCKTCGTKKHHSLMLNDTQCIECSDLPSQCKQCGKEYLKITLVDGICKYCSAGVSSPNEINSQNNSIPATNNKSKPLIVDLIKTSGWLIFILLFICGVFLSSNFSAIWGIGVIGSGTIQLILFLGLAEIVDQLSQINEKLRS
jgi:hypothetical protein